MAAVTLRCSITHRRASGASSMPRRSAMARSRSTFWRFSTLAGSEQPRVGAHPHAAAPPVLTRERRVFANGTGEQPERERPVRQIPHASLVQPGNQAAAVFLVEEGELVLHGLHV